ncbi:MAG TPA: PIG-L deacetylase family protein [Acidimicrobiales bacterium]|jgi:LmbE family N-acetylglucosaminyl deacetylase|nr:PIG-L deacetylase family protein [Acidimicrobiales bacterium]
MIEATPGVVLAVYAHPDDADVGCGGTLARWAKGGSAVHLIVCTDGGKGTSDPGTKPKKLAAERADELEASSVLIGLASVGNLGFPDGELTDSDQFRKTLVARVRELRPDVVCGHDPTAVFFGQDYFNHRDHRIAGLALLDAVAPAAALPHYFPDAGPPHRVSTVLLSGTLEPDDWVDVSDTIETKAEAVECHRSQFAGQEGWAGEAVRRRAAEEGRRAGVAYAEGFRRLSLGG